MFFFTPFKKEFALPTLQVSRITSIFIFFALLLNFQVSAALTESNPNLGPITTDKTPNDVEKTSFTSVFEGSLIASLEIVSKEPAASGTNGNTDVIVRYTVKNEGTSTDTVNNLQVDIDLLGQIGAPPFVQVTGDLSAMTGSGYTFGSPLGLTDPVYGGTLNPNYNGNSEDSLFIVGPTLRPGQCVSIDIPFELGDTTTTEPVFLNAFASGVLEVSGMDISSEVLPPLTLLAACESESLACAGEVNVSLGIDCQAIITINSVFLNQIIDPNRYTVQVFYGTTLLGDTLNESHVGLDLKYTVFDGCFGGRASCWGDINLENKNFPVRSSTYQEICCGEIPANLAPLEDIIAQINDQCFVDITNFTEINFDDADKCDGGLTGRVILGEYEIDGWKFVDTVHIDSIFATPLDIDSIDAPLGGPDIIEAIYVDCDSLKGAYPTPEFIKNYVNSFPASTGDGIAHAYPHIDKGTIEMAMFTEKDTIIEILIPDTFYVNDIEIIGIRVEKDTLVLVDTTYITKPNLVPVKTGTTCNLTVNYEDEYFAGCVGDSSKIKRSWKLLDWCDTTAVEFTVLEQWIVIQDFTGPKITFADTAYVATQPWTCDAIFPLEALVEDNCSEIRNLNWRASAGVIENDTLRDVTFEDNPIYVTLQAIDACGNDSTKSFVLLAIDSIAPIALAKDQVNTTIIYDVLNERGIAKVTAASIDAGSNDSNCGPVTVCVLLDEELSNPIRDEFGIHLSDSLGNLIYHAAQCEIDGFYDDQPYVICKEAVKFCCDMVGIQKVALLANDRSPNTPPGISWTNVNVEDKSFPIVTCQDAFVYCGDTVDPDEIGYPEISNGLCNGGELTYFDSEELGDCGAGVIYRTWLVNGDTSCVQEINIEAKGSFDPRGIKWPKHYDDQRVNGIVRWCEGDTLRETPGVIDMGSSFICSQDNLDEPTWCPSTCSLLFVSFEDQDVEAGAACKKIIRTWTIIDWCIYDPNSDNEDVDNDSFEAVSDENIDTPNILSDIDNEGICVACDKPVNDSENEVFYRYTDVDLDGFYTFQQVIKVIDDTAPVVDAQEEVVIEVSGGATFKGDDRDGCEVDTLVTAKVIELCGDIVLSGSTARWVIEIIDEDSVVIDTKVAFGDSVSVRVRGLANQELTVVWTVNDGCENQGSAQTRVIFEDVIDPTPICISDLTIATMSGGSGATIWASDYGNDSYDNCSDVKFFFLDDEGVATSSLAFTCDDIPNGLSTVKQLELFVSDEAGNLSSCNVSIRIDDNNDICVDSAVGSASISGQIITHLGDMIEDAVVSLNGIDNEVTSVNGAYAFDDLPMASSYRINSIRSDDPLNGVSTLDIVLIQRHILAQDLFNSPYKVIAADINNDERVSAIDLVQLRRLILGIVDDFQHNESWRFVDPNQQFQNVRSPWPINEDLVIQNLLRDMPNQNMLGIKIGDVSGNAIANSLLSENRSIENLEVLVENADLINGQTMDIPILLTKEMQLSGLQLTLETSGLLIEGVSSPSFDLDVNSFKIHDDQTVTIAWANNEPVTVQQELLMLKVRALTNIDAAQAIRLTSNITKAVAYDAELSEFNLVKVVFGEDENSIIATDFELFQNEPNPFSTTTKIGFRLPSQDQVRLIITDVSGKVVYLQSGVYNQGFNEITINKDQLNTQGVLYYRIETSGHTSTKRMILID